MPRLPRCLDRLSWRIVAPIFAVMTLFATGLYVIFFVSVQDFALNQVREKLEWAARDLYNAPDKALDDLYRSGQATDTRAVAIRKGLVLGEIEDVLRQGGLSGLVYRGESGQVLLARLSPTGISPAEVIRLAAPQRDVVPFQAKGGRHYAYHFDFQPWDWHFVLVEDSGIYDSLAERMQKVYLGVGLAILLLTGLLLTWMKRSIQKPIAGIIDSLQKGEPPRCESVEEFSYLSQTIRSMMASLSEKTDWLNSILSTVGALIVVCDPDETIVAFNATAAAVTGYAEEDMLGRRLWDGLIPGPGQEEARQAFASLRTGQGRVVCECPARTRDGRTIHILWTNTVVSGPDGAIRWIIASGIDISQRKAAEENIVRAEENYRSIFEHAIEGFFQASPGGFFISANPAMASILGFDSPEELLSEVSDIAAQLFHQPQDLEEIMLLLRRQGMVRGFEAELIRRDGSTIWVTLNARAVLGPGGLLVYCEGTLEDITVRRAAEEEVRRLNEGLEARVALRTCELELANKELKGTLAALRAAQNHLVLSEKMAALGSLVAGVAHEINTPVGIGVTAASYLEGRTREVRGLFEDGKMKRADLQLYLETSSESAAMILSNLRRASDLIRSFKRVAVDQSTEERRSFRLNEYLQEVLMSLGPRLKKTRHRVEVACDPALVVDSYPGAFSQIVSNLVMNSLVHAYGDTDEGHIRLAVLQEGSGIRLCYSDDGRGIPAEAQGRIFEPFFTTSRHTGGTGLGLHILYNIVTRTLGGTVTCDSTPGRGTTFTITIPSLTQREARTADTAA